MKHSLLLTALYAFIYCLALCLSSQLSFDIGLMTPLTAQTLILLIGASILSPIATSLGILLYFTFGIIGLPVFADASSGWSSFSGTSLGYFIGFLVSGYWVSRLLDSSSFPKKYLPLFTVHFAAHLIILFLGFLFLHRFLNTSDSFQHGAKYFIVPAMIKSVLSALLVLGFFWYKKSNSSPLS